MNKNNSENYFKRRNSFPKISKKSKIFQFKSLDIPINTSNLSPQNSHNPNLLPSHINNVTTSIQQDFSKIEEKNLLSNDVYNSSSNQSITEFYCKKCRMQRNLSANSTSDEDKFEKVMPLSLPSSKITKIVASNSLPIIQNLKVLEKNEKFDSIEIEKRQNKKENDEILKIQDLENIETSSISYETIESKRTSIITATEECTDSNLDLYVADVLTESLKQLPEGGSDTEPIICKSQFIGSSLSAAKIKQKEVLGNNCKEEYLNSKLKQDKSLFTKESKCQDNNKFEPTHLILTTELLKKLNVDFVLLNFGSVYPSSSNIEKKPITRNLNKIQKADSLEVNASSTTNESSCSASEDSSNNQKMIKNRNSQTMKSTSCDWIRKNEEKLLETDNKTTNPIITLNPCSNIQERNEKSLNKKETLKQTETKTEKSEKKNKTSSANSPCFRICPGLAHFHQNHPRFGSHHSKTSKVRRTPSNSSSIKKSQSSPAKGEIKKMTIFQTQSDIITPDKESGPKRFYQKTEINDGEKRIEILEIVECSEKCYPSSSEKSRKVTGTTDKMPLEKDICFPKPKDNKKSISKFDSNISQKSIIDVNDTKTKINSPTSSHLISKATVKDVMTQTIPTPSSNCILCKNQEKLPKHFTEDSLNVIRSPNAIRRKGTPGKYHQVFEIIPEEKSSISTDSSSEDNKKSTKNKDNEKNSINSEKQLQKSKISDFNKTNSTHGSYSSATEKKLEQNTLKSCLITETKSDHKQSIEEDASYQSTETSQTDRSNQYTITSPSTVTANAGSVTPKNVSATTFPTSSAESCNVIKPISTSFIMPNSSETSSSTPITFSKNLPQMEKNEEFLKHDENEASKESVKETKNVPETIQNQNLICTTKNDYIWRVDTLSCSDDYIKKSFPISLYNSSTSTSSVCLTPLMSYSNECFISNKSSLSRDLQCSRCCFCNPLLHECSDLSTDSTNCLYCNRKKTPKLEEAQTNTDYELFCRNNCSLPCHYCHYSHTSSTTNQTIITNKCTQTELITKTYEPKKNSNNINLKDTKNKKSFLNHFNKSKNSKQNKKLKENKEIKLPKMKFKNSCVTTNQNSSSNSTLSSSSIISEKESSIKSSSTSHTHKSDYKKITKDIGVQKESTPENIGNNSIRLSEINKNSGWSVTVTGSCQDLVPDVEMKLKFPKTNSQLTDEKQLLETASKDIKDEKEDSERINHLALPSNKKSLSRTTSDVANSPDISPSLSRRQLIPSKNLNCYEKHDTSHHLSKSCKNPPKGRRTMSYHVISTHHSGIIHHERNCHIIPPLLSPSPSSHDFIHLNDDHHYPMNNYNCRKLTKAKSLTITGNAIEPEKKPKVPTMSEKDLIRQKKANKIFTRNTNK